MLPRTHLQLKTRKTGRSEQTTFSAMKKMVSFHLIPSIILLMKFLTRDLIFVYLVQRRRKFNELNCDSPMSSKTSSHESEEEEKQPNSVDEEKLCDSYSNYLLGQLKTIGSEEDAFSLIKKCMYEYKNHGKSTKPRSEIEKKKINEKNQNLVRGFVRTLMRDNDALKKGFRKLWHTNEENISKVNQFDNLAEAYKQLNQQHENLKRSYEIAIVAAEKK